MSCEYEDNESIEDAGERESDSQILTSLSRKIKGSIESLNAYPSAETKNKFDARKANDATYTWDLWKEMPLVKIFLLFNAKWVSKVFLI